MYDTVKNFKKILSFSNFEKKEFFVYLRKNYTIILL